MQELIQYIFQLTPKEIVEHIFAALVFGFYFTVLFIGLHAWLKSYEDYIKLTKYEPPEWESQMPLPITVYEPGKRPRQMTVGEYREFLERKESMKKNNIRTKRYK